MTKGNDGRAARRRAIKQILCISILVLVCMVVVLSNRAKNGESHGKMTRHQGVRIPINRQQPRHLVSVGDGGDSNRHSRRLPSHIHHVEDMSKKYDETEMDPHDVAVRFREDLLHPLESKDEIALLEDVLEARIHLIDIFGVKEEVIRSAPHSYNGVYGRFCRLNFEVHKTNPSSAPMFRDIVAQSKCYDTFELDLKKITYLARERDQQVKESATEEVPKVLNFTAAAFHESRCGSTLVANSMIAMDPKKHRTYSESAPPVAALTNICGPTFQTCSEAQAAKILQDVIYMMSRTDDPKEERVFFKFQSITSQSISTFQLAFPDVAWLYVFRDPVQVMMSHVKDDPDLKRAICTRTRLGGRHPQCIRDIAKRHGYNDSRDLSAAQYCAVHLASLTESAVNNLNDLAIPVNYDQLPNILWEKIIPKIFGRPLSQTEIDNMEAVSHDYSKGRGQRAGQFKGDSEQKANAASDEVKEAAKEFLQESYDKLDTFQPKLLLS